jgi:uncharacterized protein (TIGR03083 family)
MTESSELAAKLASEGQKLQEFFAGLDDSRWAVEVYADGQIWTVREVLAHIVTTERAFVELFDRIRQGGPGVSEDFQIDRYNSSQQRKTRGSTPQELLAAYREWRAQMVAWVSTLNQADLEKRGRHPFLGVTTLREMLKMLYIHNQTHYRDIQRAFRI